MPWLRAMQLDSARLILEPLQPQHATEMVAVLAAPELYVFICGEPPNEDTLHTRYRRQSAGHSPAGDAGWLNWVTRMKEPAAAVGFVQATLTVDDGVVVADVAWLVAPSEQNQGIATEASALMLDWLLDQQGIKVRAFIHPDHEASNRIAQRLGHRSTVVVVDGELLWERSDHIH